MKRRGYLPEPDPLASEIGGIAEPSRRQIWTLSRLIPALRFTEKPVGKRSPVACVCVSKRSLGVMRSPSGESTHGQIEEPLRTTRLAVGPA